MVPPPQGAVVATAAALVLHRLYRRWDESRLRRRILFPVPTGYEVIPPPIGATVNTLPDGAVDQNINGTTYFTFGGAYYRPFYSGSSVIYEVVANPT